MTQQTEAQRLADEAARSFNDTTTYRTCNVSKDLLANMSAELHRLDAIEQRYNEMMANPCQEWDGKAYMQAIANLRERLADAEAERNQAQSAIEGFVMTLGEVAAEREQLRSQLAKAVAEEREACAKVCEYQADRFMQASPLEGNRPYASHECAAAIRARSNT